MEKRDILWFRVAILLEQHFLDLFHKPEDKQGVHATS